MYIENINPYFQPLCSKHLLRLLVMILQLEGLLVQLWLLLVCLLLGQEKMLDSITLVNL
jgi:hypothetical protein